MPFVQGQLSKKPVSVVIATSCAQTQSRLQIEIDHSFKYQIIEGEAPLIFVPLVDFDALEEPSIIDPF